MICIINGVDNFFKREFLKYRGLLMFVKRVEKIFFRVSQDGRLYEPNKEFYEAVS